MVKIITEFMVCGEENSMMPKCGYNDFGNTFNGFSL